MSSIATLSNLHEGLLQTNTIAINSWDELISWCCIHFDHKGLLSAVQKLALGAYVYQVWAERNRRVYSSTEMNARQVTALMITDVKIKLANKKIKLTNLISNKMFVQRWNLTASFYDSPIIQCVWSKPPSGIFMINSDGSVKDYASGHGAIIRNSAGEVIALACGSSNSTSPILAELNGILMGLTMAGNHHIHQIVLNVDSLVAVKMIQSKNNPPWYLKSMILSINSLISSFSSCTIGHIFRESNRAADFLAGMLPNCDFFELDLNHQDPQLLDIIKEDAEGKAYLRK